MHLESRRVQTFPEANFIVCLKSLQKEYNLSPTCSLSHFDPLSHECLLKARYVSCPVFEGFKSQKETEISAFMEVTLY